jgi:polar amino acid transport system ATP-binding protein
MIRVRGLAKSYGARAVLGGLDAEVHAGECVAVTGPSGCGKSTLLRCMNGLEPFDGGTIEIAGHTLSAGGPGDRTGMSALRSLREHVGMIFQDLHLFPHLTALENVALAPRVVARAGATQTAERARALLGRVGLADRAAAYPHELSGGQRQRVAIARALAMPLRVLLLDEPTSALDPGMRDEVRELLRALVRESSLTMVVVTHEMRFAEELADRIWVMRAGRLEASEGG